MFTWVDEPIRTRLLDIGFNLYWKQQTSDGISGQTALHLATDFRRQETVDFLIDNGADVNARDGQGILLHCYCVR